MSYYGKHKRLHCLCYSSTSSKSRNLWTKGSCLLTNLMMKYFTNAAHEQITNTNKQT